MRQASHLSGHGSRDDKVLVLVGDVYGLVGWWGLALGPQIGAEMVGGWAGLGRGPTHWGRDGWWHGLGN